MEILNLGLHGIIRAIVPAEQKKSFESYEGFALLYKDPRDKRTCSCMIFNEEIDAIIESLHKAETLCVLTTIECYHAFKALNGDKNGSDTSDGKIIFGQIPAKQKAEESAAAVATAAVGGAYAHNNLLGLYVDLNSAGAASAHVPMGTYDPETGKIIRMKH